MKVLIAPLSMLICACLLLAGCGREYVKEKPDEAEVTGTYEMVKLRLENDLSRSVRQQNASITIKADHKAAVVDFPKFSLNGDELACRLSGSAEWQLSDRENGGVGWSVVFNNFNPTAPSKNNICNTAYPMPSLLILGRQAPHGLYMIVGNPDDDQGIELAKVP